MTIWVEIDVNLPGESEGGKLRVPLQVRQELGLRDGQAAYLHLAGQGSFVLNAYSPEVHQVIEAGMEIMSEYRETFEALAKS